MRKVECKSTRPKTEESIPEMKETKTKKADNKKPPPRRNIRVKEEVEKRNYASGGCLCVFRGGLKGLRKVI